MYRWTAAALVLSLSACGGVEQGELGTSADDARAETAVAALPEGWHELPAAPLSKRYGATAVWVDGSLLVFGGRDTSPCPPNADCNLPDEAPLRDGARFDPGTHTWTRITDLPVDVERASTVVDGPTVFLSTVSYTGTGWVPRFLSYDSIEDSWEELPLPPGAAESWVADLELWDDGIIVVASTHEQGRTPDLVYDPDTRAYSELPEDPFAPSYDRDLTAVAGRLVLTAIGVGSGGPPKYRVATYASDQGWRELPAGDVVGFNPEWLAVDGQLINPTPGWTDGGQVNRYDRHYPYGGILDPATGTWSSLPDPPAASDGERVDVGRVMGDDQLLVGYDGWALLPHQDRWVRIEPPTAGPQADAAAAVGDGRLYLFGGTRWHDGRTDQEFDAELFDRGWVYEPTSPAVPTPGDGPAPTDPSPAATELGLELVVEPATISAGDDVSFWLINRGPTDVLTGLPFTVERWEDGRWVDATTSGPRDLLFRTVGIILGPGEASDERWKQWWPDGYHEYPPPAGRYRVTKQAQLSPVTAPEEHLVVRAEFEVVS